MDGVSGSADQPVTSLPGVGPSVAAKLDALGITRLQDLWFHLPLRYEDRTTLTPIRDAPVGGKVQVEGVVEAVEKGFRFKPQLKVAIGDASGATLLLRFFHFRAAQAEQMKPGTRLRCYGEVRLGANGAEMVHPSWQRVADDAGLAARLTPVYPAAEGLGQPRIAALVAKALERLPPDAELECMPRALLARFKLGSLRDALRYVHHPPANADVAALLAGRHPAQLRLAFDELVAHNLSLKRLRRAVQSRRAARIAPKRTRRAALLAALPFRLTGAQQRVLAEIDADLATGRPMLRLVQGDVGSGKTVVAALAALAAIDAGGQAAVMAPTEVLAEQHARTFRRWLEPLGLNVAWLAGKVKGKARAAALASVAGDADLVVGTHALMQEGVAFRNLVLAVIDEQHRFGVHQRLALREKGAARDVVPHQLVMTATPIPRTLAMTAYADLDASVVDELPPGRTPVQTVALAASRRADVIDRIRHACAEGRQAYWVCTLIEESDVLEAQAAEAVAAELAAALPGVAVGLVHGRLKAAAKQAAMDAFQRGECQLLVATTVIVSLETCRTPNSCQNRSVRPTCRRERLAYRQRSGVGRAHLSSGTTLLARTSVIAC